jgi:Asp-tRNA(Asn)/Glu-tRNA(Gln) amidotransferase B subunit
VNFLAGQVMKASRGKANPNLARDMIQRRLSEPGR